MTLRQWVTGAEDHDYHFVARTHIRDDLDVITVWNGMSMGDVFSPDKHPRELFGTITRHGETYLDEVQTDTEDQALAEHNRRVAELEKF